MQSYVLGFAFSQNLQHVVLIKKDGNSVPAHKGLLNGVGGKIEELETALDAMTREFEEETGVEIPAAGWIGKGEFYGPAFRVEVFATVTDKVFEARTIGDEHVVVIPVNMRKGYFECAPHVEWLIPLCLNPAVESFSVAESSWPPASFAPTVTARCVTGPADSAVITAQERRMKMPTEQEANETARRMLDAIVPRDFVQEVLNDLRAQFEQKNKEYKGATNDRWRNFSQGGELQSETPEQTLLGYVSKQVVNLFDAKKHNPERLTDVAFINEKAGDIAVYMVILMAMVREKADRATILSAPSGKSLTTTEQRDIETKGVPLL